VTEDTIVGNAEITSLLFS